MKQAFVANSKSNLLGRYSFRGLPFRPLVFEAFRHLLGKTWEMHYYLVARTLDLKSDDLARFSSLLYDLE